MQCEQNVRINIVIMSRSQQCRQSQYVRMYIAYFNYFAPWSYIPCVWIRASIIHVNIGYEMCSLVVRSLLLLHRSLRIALRTFILSTRSNTFILSTMTQISHKATVTSMLSSSLTFSSIAALQLCSKRKPHQLSLCTFHHGGCHFQSKRCWTNKNLRTNELNETIDRGIKMLV